MAFRIQRIPSATPSVAFAARGLAIVLALMTAGLVLAALGYNPLALGWQVLRTTPRRGCRG